MKINTNNKYFNYRIFDFSRVGLFLFLFSYLFSGFFVYKLYNIHIALFDIFFVLYSFILFKEKSFFYKLPFFKPLIYLNLYIFFVLIYDLYFFTQLEDIIIQKKILLFLQLFRSSGIFLITFYLLSRSKSKLNINFVLDLFSFYCVLVLFIFLIDISSNTRIVSTMSDTIRLKGFFRDPNFFGLFTSFFCFLAIYLKKNIVYVFLFMVVTLLCYSKTSFIYLVFIICIYSFIFKNSKKLSRFEIWLKNIVIVVLASYLFLNFIDIFRYIYLDKEPSLRFYVFIDLFNQKRFIMAQNFLSQDINILFGNGIYELTKYSKSTFGNFSHNSFIDIFFDYGFLGIILFFYFFYSVIKNINNSIDNYLFLFLGFIPFITLYLFAFSLFYMPFLWFFYGFIAYILNKKKY